MLHHTKTLGIVEVDQAVWKKTRRDEKEEILRVCEDKLDTYFRRITDVAP